MLYEFQNDGYITVKYNIVALKAIFSRDIDTPKNERILADINITCDEDVPDDLKEWIENKICHKFDTRKYKLYDGWELDIANDLREYTGVWDVEVEDK